jgi:plasmid stabilization system protein ParE
MKYEIFIRSIAENDISDIVFWYENQVPGLGNRFITSLDATFHSIKRNPQIYPKIYKEFRRALLPRFPYAVFYIIEKNSVIVLAVMHGKREPKTWQKRTT